MGIVTGETDPGPSACGGDFYRPCKTNIEMAPIAGAHSPCSRALWKRVRGPLFYIFGTFWLAESEGRSRRTKRCAGVRV